MNHLKAMFGTPKPKTNEEIKDEYCAALGRFISAYAVTEGMVHMCFRKVSGIPANVARILSSDWRLSNLGGPIRQLAAANKMSEEVQKEIDCLLTHLNEIAQFRHRLIHRGADLEGEFFVSSNWVSMKSIEDFEQVKFTVGDLRDATIDLRSMTIRFYWVSHPEEANPSDMTAVERALILAPWRCKLPKPETPNRPPPQKRRSRARPPRA